ncbi:MAG: hypothetical protein FRX48_06001 [Lasallia pustulata]|uniref:Luciferase domain-containing protein n=1 Tax=Lasallia pustulata TaxID=136370 RepID=A0A5M8PMC2_9LECA|nr:MAG: hypothetical protein FRX48_06001 [Lasallia pustulata]
MSLGTTLLLLALAVPLILLIRRDYHAFLGLGPGGTPSTFPGYLKRQLTQTSPPDLIDALHLRVRNIAVAHPKHLSIGVSCIAKHGLALNVSSPKPLNPTCGPIGEVCHLHASDGSMHLTLHPSDAALVIARGWAERHPLGEGGLFGERYVPRSFLMVYAPRIEEECEMVVEVVRAGMYWVGGLDFRGE